MQRSLTLLNEMGDLTITWESDKDDEMAKIIQKKMNEGVRFFIISDDDTQEKQQIKGIFDIKDRVVSIPDDDIAKMFSKNKINIIGRLFKSINNPVTATSDPKEVVKTNSIGVKQYQGG